MISLKMNLKIERKEILIIVRRIHFQVRLHMGNVVVFMAQKCGIQMISIEKSYGSAIKSSRIKLSAKTTFN